MPRYCKVLGGWSIVVEREVEPTGEEWVRLAKECDEAVAQKEADNAI